MAIILLVGASGSGKSTIGKMLEDKFNIPQLTSFTTRPMREGEVDGVDYHFVTKEDLPHMDLIESSEYNGNVYGLSDDEVTNKLDYYEHVYFIADKNGAEQIANMFSNIAVYFWLNTSIETMVERMRKRGDSDEQIISRMEHAIDTNELRPPKCDYVELDALKNTEESVDKIISLADFNSYLNIFDNITIDSNINNQSPRGN